MFVASALKIAFIAGSLGLDSFAVCIGVGVRGTDPGSKLRIGATFAFAEVTMLLAGVLIGAAAGKQLGEAAGYFGFAALAVVGGLMVGEALRGDVDSNLDLSRGWGLALGAISMSFDSLGIGFSILFIGVPLIVAVACIAAASIISTTLGLTMGKLLGTRLEEAAAFWAGLILLGTGVGFAALKYFGVE